MTEFSVLYGGSLYALACAEGLCERLLADLELVDTVLTQQPEYKTLLDSPTVMQTEKVKLLDAAFSAHVHPYTSNFLKILAEKKQMYAFAATRRAYVKKYNAEHNIEEAVAITAVPMTETLLAKLQKKLSKMTGKTVVLQNKVDPEILGGLTVRMANRQIDASVRSRLLDLEAQIKMNS